MPVCVLKYNFDGPEHSFEVAPHGNSKGRTGYMRTMPSTLDLLRKEAQSYTPKVAVEVVDDAIVVSWRLTALVVYLGIGNRLAITEEPYQEAMNEDERT